MHFWKNIILKVWSRCSFRVFDTAFCEIKAVDNDYLYELNEGIVWRQMNKFIMKM